jgi:hypothetical protein
MTSMLSPMIHGLLMAILSESVNEIGIGGKDANTNFSNKCKGCLEKSSKQPINGQFTVISQDTQVSNPASVIAGELTRTLELALVRMPQPHRFECSRVDRQRIFAAALGSI